MGCCFTTKCRRYSDNKTESFLDKYSNFATIHDGNTHRVLKCTHNNKILSCKVIPIKSSSWKKEIKILKYIKNKNLPSPKLITINKNEKFIYIFYDYIEGIDLFQYFKLYGPFTEKQTQLIIYKLLHIVYKHHKHHIWHLDLKLENIICYKGQINELKLIDFGHAILSKKQFKKTLSKGTLGYSAPELDIELSSSKSDIWSIGVITYVLLFNEYPFPLDKTEFEDVFKNIKRYWKKKLKKITPECKDFILKCLKYDIDRRATLIQLLNHKWMQFK